MARTLPQSAAGHDYLSVSNFLENDDSNSSSDGEPNDKFRAFTKRIAANPRVAQRLTIASAVLGLLVGLVLLMLPGKSQPNLAPVHSAVSGLEAEAVQLDAVNETRQHFLKSHVDAAWKAAQSLLKPSENMHDGNLCDANEELFGGLCYRTCNLLTNGQAPIRTSAFTCCEHHPCRWGNQRGGVLGHIVCSGYDVGGTGGCPHKPGACLVNEEMHLGVCYKKCADLTEGRFPHRTAAATCCKTTGIGCLNFMNLKTSKAFDVGGGAGDEDPSTPAQAHPPMKSLTEAADAKHDSEAGGRVAKQQPATTQAPIAKPHFSEGDTCGGEEELHQGLCYRKCALLTDGEAPLRTSSWTCCEAHPCTLFNQRGNVGKTIMCNGFDIAGNGKCPHKPGTCFDDEEIQAGVCYKTCAELTKGEYPFRSAAATCCKTRGWKCLLPSNSKTSDAFAVGSSKEQNSQQQ